MTWKSPGDILFQEAWGTLVRDQHFRVVQLRGLSQDEAGNPIKDRSAMAPDDVAAQFSLREQVDAALPLLRDREWRVLELRFRLADGRPRNLEEIGGELSLTREGVRQIERKALGRLRSNPCVADLCELLA